MDVRRYRTGKESGSSLRPREEKERVEQKIATLSHHGPNSRVVSKPPG